MFRPSAQQFATVIRVKHRIETTVNGAPDISYQDANPALDFCNWKGKGGTENISSGTLVVEDTAEVTMWYRPDITKKSRLLLNDDPNKAYEVINEPENVEQRNMWLFLKVKRVVNA